jgi:hypothetical protein
MFPAATEALHTAQSKLMNKTSIYEAVTETIWHYALWLPLNTDVPNLITELCKPFVNLSLSSFSCFLALTLLSTDLLVHTAAQIPELTTCPDSLMTVPYIYTCPEAGACALQQGHM